MGGLSALAAQAITTPNKFNWPWFVELCVCGITALFFLFYFNRLFATLLSYGLRAYAWHHYRVWVDIQALQISLLGGRVFFKGVRYHGENETIFVHNGHVTWRYWFRNVRHVDLTTDDDEDDRRPSTAGLENESNASSRASVEVDEEHGATRKQDNHEARIAVFVTGVEWFVYNRTPLYDAILRGDASHEGSEEIKNGSTSGVASSEALKVHLRSKFRQRPKSSESSSSDTFRVKEGDSEKIPSIGRSSENPIEGQEVQTTEDSSAESDITVAQSILIRLLPVHIECSRAAILIGNEHTRAILVTTVDKAKGNIDARGCGPNDFFRQIFEFDIEHPVVQMRPNPDFTGSQFSSAEHIIMASDALGVKKRWWRWNLDLERRRHNAAQTLRNLVPGLQSSVESLHHGRHRQNNRTSRMAFTEIDASSGEWHGLSRYLDESDTDDHQAWTHVDYARFSTILDCPSAHMTFYWDTPGRVKAAHHSNHQPGQIKDINGVKAPAYGLDLAIRGGIVNYGPWADRLRAEIQSVFFPAAYRTPEPAKPLQVGQWRQSTSMVIRVDIDEEVTMRVPTRENSKDWRWRGRATAVRDAAAIRKQRQKRHFRLKRGPKSLLGPDIRPFGWISFSVSPNSSVRYDMDMVPGSNGYVNNLLLDLKDTRATSSVNHAELWRCSNQRVQCDLSNPLIWNSQHTWQFNIQNQSMDMFLLRDHMFLLTDLIADFTAGQKANYMTFVPFEYKIGLMFDDWKLFLNANDFNIIDSPCDLESNAFLVLGMSHLQGNVDIPIKYFSAPQSSVKFRAQGSDLFLDLKTPVWNTIHSFANDENMATLKRLGLAGSYNYNSGTSPSLTDSLFLDILGGSPKFHLQGFLIRYFMNVKENYFGEDLHFRTLEEYQSRLGPDNRFLAEDQKRTAKKDNDLDVILNVRAEESCALMPSNIYARDENLRVDVMLIEADMRFTNYYMDLQVNSSPIEVSIESDVSSDRAQKRYTTNCQLFIDTVSVYGHRLFGAPPTEPTYVCNWDFDVGSIYGECSSDFVRILAAAVQSFIFTFDDEENALPVTRESVLNDVTFLRARVHSIQLWIVTDLAAFLLKAGRSNIAFNDWAGEHFSKNLKGHIPSITIAAVDSHRASRRHELNHAVPTLACIQTSIQIVNIDRKAHFEHERQLQQNHIKFHDLRTYRASCLLHDTKPLNVAAKEVQWSQDPAAMPVPDLPIPLYENAGSLPTSRSALRARRNKGSSFLSSRSSKSLASRSSKSSKNSELRPSQPLQSAIPGLVKRNLEAGNVDNQHKMDRPHVNKLDTKDDVFSSPWIEPHFPILRLRPDFSYMPSIDPALDEDVLEKPKIPGAEQDYTDSEEALPHGAIFCNLLTGLKGFCSPLLFPAIVRLLQDIAPHDPQSLLDAIQRTTLKNIKKLMIEDHGEKIDIALRIPVAAFRIIDTDIGSNQIAKSSADQYDLIVSHVRLNGRIAPTVTRKTHGETKENIFLVQASIRNIEVSIAEGSISDTVNVARLQTSIGDIDFWLSLQDEIRSKLQVGSFRVSTGSSTVDRLSMLVERARVMITKIVEDFEQLDQGYNVRHLIYHLSLLHTETADPVFLSKPSYVLRSAAEHIRLADSWKIVSRLRQRLLLKSQEEQAELVEHGTCLFEQHEENAQQQILESIENWMTWDQTDEACGPIRAAIFGQDGDTSKAVKKVEDVELGVYLGEISIVIDPGPQQSELLLQSGSFNLSQKPVFERRHKNQSQSTHQASRMRIQVWFADIGLDVNWNLIELARSLVKQMNLSAAIAKTSHEHRASTSKDRPSELDLMIVAGTDIATAKLRTINLNVYTAARDLKVSVVVQNVVGSSTTSILLASTSAQLKLASQFRKLFNWKLEMPTMYGLYQKKPHSLQGSDTARFAASCDRLRFDMKGDILSMLEVVDTVIRDEVVIIQEVIDSIEQQANAVKPHSGQSSLKLEDVHVAFFLHNYKLHFCLLPGLYYNIVGMVARTSLVPQQAAKYAVHIDVKNNTHTLFEPNRPQRDAAATIEIPPISGRLMIELEKEYIGLSARSTLEKVQIEASAVRACIETVYQPQNVERFKDAKFVIDRIQRSVKRLNKPPTQSEAPTKADSSTQRKLLYSGHAIFEGVDVHVNAPASQGQNYRADLRFGLQQTIMRIHNYHLGQKTPLQQPQFEVKLRRVFIDLSRQTRYGSRNFGHFAIVLRLTGTTHVEDNGDHNQNYRLQSESARLDLFTETPALMVDIATFLQGRFAEMTTVEDRQRIKPLRRLTLGNNDVSAITSMRKDDTSDATLSSNILDTTFSLDLNAIRIRWIVANDLQTGFGRMPEDLVFSIRQIDLRTQRESSARLMILDTQLQTVPKNQEDPTVRTANSALLPEMIFNAAHFSTKQDRRFAFQAAGKALDLRLAADGILPLSTVQRSLARATADLWNTKPTEDASEKPATSAATNFLGNKRLASLLVDADFAGAVVRITPRLEKEEGTTGSVFGLLKGPKRSRAGRYGQAVQSDGTEEAILRAPGIAIKVEYLDTGQSDPTLSTEVKVAASSNILSPAVVPLGLEIYSSIKEIIGDDQPSENETKAEVKTPAQKYLTDATDPATDPTAILGSVKLTAGLWVQKQEFSLTCQPIARVAATARFEEIFITINTVQEDDHERFFSIITTFNKLQASVQHVYSRESTASFEVDSIIMSLMNSKHVNTKNGISAILNVSPMKASLNAKQMQDFLLFREIWYPAELRRRSTPPAPATTASESQAYAMQKYHELAATAALPWHAIVSIQELKLDIDFGQSLGKSSFMIAKLWASSKKNSDWEQNLCIGFDRVGIDSTGRMSGFIELKGLQARTSIRWPVSKDSGVRAPLVQASVGFSHLRLKAAFDYQPFAVADVSSFQFLMYNIRPSEDSDNDRLVGVLNGGKVQVFCISTAAAQAFSIVQAFERLIQEKREAFQESLRELDKLLRRRSLFPLSSSNVEPSIETGHRSPEVKRQSHRLHTDVVVSIKVIDIGAFPNTFFDTQILKVEAVDVQARFAVAMHENKIHSGLGMKLGQVRVALSVVNRANTKALGEVEIGEVIDRATNSRGGTILKVPQLVASMQTWQEPHASVVEYIFRSTFQGKVDVGWNYSRIRFIRNMWETHSQALAHRLGKPLPPAAVKITAEPQREGSEETGQEKITAVVNMPQSTRFRYVALEPPIIDTPQLRDMGEATPPLEWIGLHRDKLPNVTHSIIIVTLLEVAKEVEDAYTRILGAG